MRDLLLTGVLAAQLFGATPGGADDPPFSPDAIRGHLEFLADDLLEGRGTATRGHEVAALYVATQFRAAGLEPAGSAGWFQPVPLVERTPNVGGAGQLIIGEERHPFGARVLGAIAGEGAQSWSGEAVYVGYGLVDPGQGVDDYEGLDVRGRAVVFSDAAPAALTPERYAELARRRLEIAHARGASGMIALMSAEAAAEPTWSEWRDGYASPFLNWIGDDGQPFRPIPMTFTAVMAPEAASALFAGAPVDAAEIANRAARGEPLAAFVLEPRVTLESENQWRRFTSPNVIGMVRGAEAGLGECILVTSHLDHLGRDPSAGADDIFNGALDNASGVAALIEVARATANAAPRRSVVFAAVTAEEIGLLGSDYLAAHGVPGCASIAAVVNLDGGVPLHSLPEAIAYGGWHSTIGAAFEAAAEATGVEAGIDETPPTEFFERTDHFSFARRGVPAIYLVMSGGDDEEASAAYRGRYHQPNDDLTLPFNWEGGARFARLAHELVRRLADGPETPRWYADSPIGQQYAPDAPKAPRP